MDVTSFLIGVNLYFLVSINTTAVFRSGCKGPEVHIVDHCLVSRLLLLFQTMSTVCRVCDLPFEVTTTESLQCKLSLCPELILQGSIFLFDFHSVLTFFPMFAVFISNFLRCNARCYIYMCLMEIAHFFYWQWQSILTTGLKQLHATNKQFKQTITKAWLTMKQ